MDSSSNLRVEETGKKKKGKARCFYNWFHNMRCNPTEVVRWKTKSAECGVWKTRSAECGVWKTGSVETRSVETRCVENAECGKRRV